MIGRARTVPLAAWLALAGFVGLLAFWATMTPAYRAPDEPQHVSAALGLAQGEGWPRPGDAEIDPGVLRSAVLSGFLTTADQPTSRGNTLPAVHVATGREQPPLYSAVPPSAPDDRRPYAVLAPDIPTGLTNQMTQHPPAYYAVQAAVFTVLDAEDWRSDRQLYLMRLVSVAMVGWLPLLAFLTVRRLSGSKALGTTAAYLPLVVPQLAHVGSTVTNDALVVLCGSVLITALSYLLTGSRRGPTLAVVVGALGVGLLTKGLVLPLVPAVAVVVLVALRRSGLRWSGTALLTLAALAGAFVVGGWWWLVNLVRLGTLQPNGLGVDRSRVGPPVGLLDYGTRFAAEVNTSFWGNFGWLEVPLPGALTTGLAVGTLLLAALAVGDRAARGPLAALAVLPAVSLGALFVALYTVHLRDGRFAGTQGRYLFGSLLVLFAAVALGLAVLARLIRLPVRWLPPITVVGAAAVAGYGGWVAFRGFYLDTGIDTATAWRTMVAWSPWPGWLVAAQAVTVAGLLLAGLAAGVVDGVRRPDDTLTRAGAPPP